jgi:uncharacterized membrane protein
MKRMLALLAVALLFIDFASAATVRGIVYDPLLRRATNVFVEIDTKPAQKILATNGTYQFTVPKGEFLLTAYTKRDGILLSAEENITIVDDGYYLLDLFLYTELDIEDLFNESDFPVEAPYKEERNDMVLLASLLGVLILVLGFVGFWIMRNTALRKRQLHESNIIDEDLKKILIILSKNKGRMSQQEIGRHFSYTDAKVSLMITELEDKGKVKKIKSGRANVIILNR